MECSPLLQKAGGDRFFQRMLRLRIDRALVVNKAHDWKNRVRRFRLDHHDAASGACHPTCLTNRSLHVGSMVKTEGENRNVKTIGFKCGRFGGRDNKLRVNAATLGKSHEVSIRLDTDRSCSKRAQLLRQPACSGPDIEDVHIGNIAENLFE